MKWVTHKNAKVDRVACPWLIKRYVDPEARFLYVADEDVMSTAEREQSIPYDVKNVELASLADVSSFTASRLLQEWERKGAVEKSRGKVLIRSPEKLLA